jgi:predicted acyltransferase
MKHSEETPFNPLDNRLYSLDALRGFDMFWIMGAEDIFHGLARVTGHPAFIAISQELDHPLWNGFRFYDLIFPLFLFLAGVATPYSIGAQLAKGKSKNELLLRVIKRGLILVLLGLWANNGLRIRELDDIRFGSVLGRIGLAYMFANIIFLYTKQMGQMIWFGGILIGYWLLLKFTSAPGFARGDLTIEGNFASYMDRMYLSGKLYRKIHDPEGLFSTIPAIGTALLGILTGTMLKTQEMTKKKKAAYMAIGGVILLVLSEIWNLDFPINKNLWSSSFVLHVGGYSLLLLSLFYYIIDVLGYKKWAFFFKIIGMNSILIYLSGKIINWEFANQGLFRWVGEIIGDPWNVVAMAICYVMVKWVFLYFLYEKKVFLRV